MDEQIHHSCCLDPTYIIAAEPGVAILHQGEALRHTVNQVFSLVWPLMKSELNRCSLLSVGFLRTEPGCSPLSVPVHSMTRSRWAPCWTSTWSSRRSSVEGQTTAGYGKVTGLRRPTRTVARRAAEASPGNTVVFSKPPSFKTNPKLCLTPRPLNVCQEQVSVPLQAIPLWFHTRGVCDSEHVSLWKQWKQIWPQQQNPQTPYYTTHPSTLAMTNRLHCTPAMLSSTALSNW